MNVLPTTTTRSGCPSPDDLAAFARGLLPVSVLEEIGSHVSSCSPCGTVLAGLSDSDPLLGDLRGGGAPAALLDEPEYRQLAAFAQALAADPAQRDTWPNAAD